MKYLIYIIGGLIVVGSVYAGFVYLPAEPTMKEIPVKKSKLQSYYLQKKKCNEKCLSEIGDFTTEAIKKCKFLCIGEIKAFPK